MNWTEQLTLRDNLYWAWSKVSSMYRSGDAWFDELAIACFEANLDRELAGLAAELRSGSYRPTPLRPLPQPKKATGENEKPVRQTFWVGVRDQVAWVAFVGVVGPTLDRAMPPWSYAYRLHRPVWYEDETDRRIFVRGPYRHTSGRLYRPFPQSWPLYRRHISLTVRAAARIRERPDDMAEEAILDAEEQLGPDDPARLPYLRAEYWSKGTDKVYRGHVDLKKFYPSINITCVLQNMRSLCQEIPDELMTLAEEMATFPLDRSGWPGDELKELGLATSEPPSASDDVFRGLPTGLFVSGFLSNVAMLGLDRTVSEETKARQVAHFRYVDDHTFLAQTLDALIAWIQRYHELLTASGVGPTFHETKIEPESVRRYVQEYVLPGRPDAEKKATTASSDALGELKADMEREAAVDPQFPTPLMTATLAKISDVARAPFVLLDDRGQQQVLQELQFLLAARLPDDEIRDDTRVSFAASRLSRLAAVATHDATDAEASKKGDRFSRLLLRAVVGYPEKLRLWTRALEFSRLTGRDDLEQIVSAVAKRAKEHASSGAYLRAYLMNFMAGQVFRCLTVVLDASRLPGRRREAATYLKALLGARFDPQGAFLYWFEQRASQLFEAARIAAAFVTESNAASNVDPLLPSIASSLQSNDDSCNRHEAFDKWAQGASELSMFTWWLDHKTVSAAATEPGAVWKQLAESLREADDGSSTVWARYPKHLPPAALKWATTPSGDAPRSNESWLYDVIRGARSRGLRSRCRPIKSPEIQHALRASSAATLEEWAQWTAKMHAGSPHDPRVGEWTAVQFAICIAEAAQHREGFDGTGLHPANIFVRRMLMAENTDARTWESWALMLSKPRNLPKIRHNKLLRDPRFAVVEQLNSDRDRSWSLVQGLGIVLLGLLSRTFTFPAVWNEPRYALAFARPTRALIRNLGISSWTTALLDACLLPRSRENLLFDDIFTVDNVKNDTTRDPPEIPDIECFLRYARKAAQVLKDHQLMVHGSMPRQLVLRNLPNVLARQANSWGISGVGNAPS